MGLVAHEAIVPNRKTAAIKLSKKIQKWTEFRSNVQFLNKCNFFLWIVLNWMDFYSSSCDNNTRLAMISLSLVKLNQINDLHNYTLINKILMLTVLLQMSDFVDFLWAWIRNVVFYFLCRLPCHVLLSLVTNIVSPFLCHLSSSAFSVLIKCLDISMSSSKNTPKDRIKYTQWQKHSY